MRLLLKFIITLSAFIPLMLMKSALAACAFAPDSALKQVVNVSMPLVGVITTIGADNADGTFAYTQYYQPTFPAPKITCSSPGQFYQISQFSSTPLPLSSWNTGNWAGKAYETGLPGLSVGISVNRASNAMFPASQPSTSCTNVSSCTISAGSFALGMSFLKTGPLTTGGVIRGSDLPCTVQSFGQSGDTVDIVRTCYTGTLTVVSQTCTTPNVNVPLGTFDANRTFTGVGTATPWKDASIKLTNCPRFYGRFRSGTDVFYSDNGTFGTGTPTKNTVYLKLTPNTTMIDAQNGIIGLSTGSTSATGVGIQLASGQVSDPAPTPLNLYLSIMRTMESDTSTSITYPFVARYIQTGATVTPGKANATVTFTITYY
ncbi:fimbrial protein [Serratia fonticola]|uniref:Type 1 fimbrial protein n=1 Tax=Serratia fonticola TaxID=47917 RepID=A0AAW3WUD8_SERFO|nr:fimbrial protein [Serratia fonticola]MBC3214214.1 type 1 fimbrial protein [Serratia fonticola]NYA13604.1 type 1 fimbrial protein [Serratia fonticola]NYA35065.1 type 1 fimbrial protein [Serratia fonticola]PAA94917.1 type 1 fimbrial protein [Serratia fonticola]